MTLKGILSQIFTADLRTLGFFRICLGIAILVDLLERSKDLIAHYSDQGLLPKSAVLEEISGKFMLSFHVLNGDWRFQAFLFFVAAILAVFVIIGFKSRASVILSFIFLVSLQNSNPYLFFGADTVLCLLLFWSIFLPLGERFSLDEKFKGSSMPNSYSAISVAGIYIQVASIYFFNSIWKLRSGTIWFPDGLGIEKSLTLNFVTPPAHILLMFPDLLKVMTYSVLALEFFGPLILLSPFFTRQIRLVVVALFTFLQINLGIFLNLGFFPVVSIVATLVFLPDTFWDKILVKFKGKKVKVLKKRMGAAEFLSSGVCLFFILYVLLIQFEPIGFDILSDESKIPARILKLNQKWNLFGTDLLNPPNHTTIVSWSGTLEDGGKIFIYDGRFSYEPVEENGYHSLRWGKMGSIVNKPDTKSLYAQFICDSWNSRHPQNQLIEAHMDRVQKNDTAGKRITQWSEKCD